MKEDWGGLSGKGKGDKSCKKRERKDEKNEQNVLQRNPTDGSHLSADRVDMDAIGGTLSFFSGSAYKQTMLCN